MYRALKNRTSKGWNFSGWTSSGWSAVSFRVPAFVLVIVALAMPLGARSAAASDIKMTLQPDGTRLIFNERPEQRARRTADRLVQTPNQDLDQLIRHYAELRQLEERLVRAVVQVESGFNVRALSVKGAQGLMQLMPATARSLAVDDAFDPAQNLMGGTLYLRSLMDRYGDLRLALAAYNAGPTAVDRHGGIPPYRETRNYVAKILRLVGNEGHGIENHGIEGLGSASAGALPSPRVSLPGPEIFITRDGDDRLVMTTTPPGGG